MILLFRTVAVLLAVAALATGCSDSSSDSGAAQPETTTPAATMSPSTTAPAPPGFPVTVIAANGAIEIPEQPSRIVSMSATHTEILFAIGAGHPPVVGLGLEVAMASKRWLPRQPPIRILEPGASLAIICIS